MTVQMLGPSGPLFGYRVAAVTLLLWLFGSFPAQAIPLALDNGAPDIASAFIDVNYDAELQALTALGIATDYLPAGQPGPPLETIENGSFQLTATVDSSGELLDGELIIGGTVEAQGFVSGNLLTGQLSELGFNPLGGDPLEFLFVVSGGDAAASFGLVGGIILNIGGSRFPGNFNASFSSASVGATADTLGLESIAVEEPASLWLLTLGVLGLCLRAIKNGLRQS